MAVENIESAREQEASGGSGQENSVTRRGNLKASASCNNFLQSGLSTITTYYSLHSWRASERRDECRCREGSHLLPVARGTLILCDHTTSFLILVVVVVPGRWDGWHRCRPSLLPHRHRQDASAVVSGIYPCRWLQWYIQRYRERSCW